MNWTIKNNKKKLFLQYFIFIFRSTLFIRKKKFPVKFK